MNNVDTCARVCHSPTGYGLKATFGESAGTQDFDQRRGRGRHPGHRRQPDRWPPGVRQPDEAAPAPGRPAHRRRPAPIDLVRTPHVEADTTCSSRPAPTSPSSTRWPTSSSPRASSTRPSSASAATGRVPEWAAFVADERNSPEAMASIPASTRRCPRAPRGSTPPAATRAIYYGLGVTEHSQGSTTVMAIANLAMATGNIGRAGRRREPAARPEQRAGLLRHGQLPARARRLPPRLRRGGPRAVRGGVGRARSSPSRACASRTCSTPRSRALQGRSTSRARTSSQSDPDTQHVAAGARGDGMRRGPGLFLNETAKLRPRLPARLDLPREGRHVHQRRAAHPAGCAR